MIQLMSLPLGEQTKQEYRDWSELSAELSALGCGGVEAIWCGEAFPAGFPRALAVGYHLTFFADWLDLWLGNEAALAEKFGSLDAAAAFYGGLDRETLLAHYRADLDRAQSLGAEYVVFHVSDVSIEETYTYRWRHSSAQVLSAAAEVIALLLEGRAPSFDFLVENQWWPGFTFTAPEETGELLSAIPWPRKGIMLDTGHLMNTAPHLQTQREGAAYIRQMLLRHGPLCGSIRGVHLHQSLSGPYVRSHTGALPPLPGDYLSRFSAGYRHILSIDRHESWTDPAVAGLLQEISPRYLVHELTGRDRPSRRRAVQRQAETLRRGGIPAEPPRQQ